MFSVCVFSFPAARCHFLILAVTCSWAAFLAFIISTSSCRNTRDRETHQQLWRDQCLHQQRVLHTYYIVIHIKKMLFFVHYIAPSKFTLISLHYNKCVLQTLY